MFVREGTQKEQMERTMFYKLTLEQRWERISACKNGDVGGNTVALTVVVPTEVVRISWTEAIPERDEAKTKNEMGLQVKIGLSLVIIERMTWEQERVGWVHGNEKQVMVARMEKYQGGDSWQKFGCYMLVEQFVLKRLDRSLVLTYDFNHTNRIRCNLSNEVSITRDLAIPTQQIAEHPQGQAVGLGYCCLRRRYDESRHSVQAFHRILDVICWTDKRNIVSGDVVAPIQRVAVYEKAIRANDGFGGKDWFRPVDSDGLEARIGVSLQLGERMKWEQETFARL
ncbi:hypothetical protein Cgig2_025115 [Carnegiea gigantea]|uniref:Uncharacterized protein n=1 Tax=Carnegiea gigantea TaxID=171969 RepID=A0A9Q1KSU6_9CARY|nr:hypothetical protein Cgig2_025115 [Carnegiea gigantea]